MALRKEQELLILYQSQRPSYTSKESTMSSSLLSIMHRNDGTQRSRLDKDASRRFVSHEETLKILKFFGDKKGMAYMWILFNAI